LRNNGTKKKKGHTGSGDGREGKGERENLYSNGSFGKEKSVDVKKKKLSHARLRGTVPFGSGMDRTGTKK